MSTMDQHRDDTDQLRQKQAYVIHETAKRGLIIPAKAGIQLPPGTRANAMHRKQAHPRALHTARADARDPSLPIAAYSETYRTTRLVR